MTSAPCKVLDDLGWTHDCHGSQELLSHFAQRKQIKLTKNHKPGELQCQPNIKSRSAGKEASAQQGASIEVTIPSGPRTQFNEKGLTSGHLWSSACESHKRLTDYNCNILPPQGKPWTKLGAFLNGETPDSMDYSGFDSTCQFGFLICN